MKNSTSEWFVGKGAAASIPLYLNDCARDRAIHIQACRWQDKCSISSLRSCPSWSDESLERRMYMAKKTIKKGKKLEATKPLTVNRLNDKW